MANPLPNEEVLYRRLEESKVISPAVMWELIDHHVKNDLTVLNLLLGEYYLTPPWILKFSSVILRFLHRIARRSGKAPLGLEELRDIGLIRVKNIDEFLGKLREYTREKQECYLLENQQQIFID